MFVCHASEDKDEIARPLAHALRDAGFAVWYDEFALKLGDSLRRSIERGIVTAQHGIVILSPHFFAKNWPQAELDGLFAINIASGNSIIPVWHGIDQADVLRKSPLLADRIASKTADGLDRVVTQILDTIEPNAHHHAALQALVSVEPRSFRLGSGPWTVKTQVTVANRSARSLYAVAVKLFPAEQLASEDILVDLPSPNEVFKAPSRSPPVSGDAIILDWIDASDRPCVFVILHTIPTLSARQLVVSGRSARDVTISATVVDFSAEPREFMATEGKVAQIIKVPETGRIKGIRFRIQR